MAITTLDGIVAGARAPAFYLKAATPTMVTGRPQSLWPLAGNPGAGAYNGTLNGVNLVAPINGQISFTNPGGGLDTYLSRFSGQASIAGSLLLCDRLWHNGGFAITSTAAQAITQPTLPARDADGATAGNSIIHGVEVSAATGAGTPTLTLNYTNESGTAGRVATNIIATVASSAIGAFYPIGLQAGDRGVRSAQSLQLSTTWTSGTINLVAYRVLAQLDLSAAFVPNAIDALTAGFPKLYNDSVPYLIFIPSTTAASVINGTTAFTQG